jgi:hypothetical protein
VAGFFVGVTEDHEDRELAIVLPGAFVVGLLALLPLLAGRRVVRWWRVRRNLASGRCLACGYDLRATPDRCPECGTVPTTKDAIPAGR